jgi:hypothetical protein
MRFRIIAVTGGMDICFKTVTNPFYVRPQIRLWRKDRYLKELVRYIHLNPLRAKTVKSLTESDNHPFTGHSALMGKVHREFQWKNMNSKPTFFLTGDEHYGYKALPLATANLLK